MSQNSPIGSNALAGATQSSEPHEHGAVLDSAPSAWIQRAYALHVLSVDVQKDPVVELHSAAPHAHGASFGTRPAMLVQVGTTVCRQTPHAAWHTNPEACVHTTAAASVISGESNRLAPITVVGRKTVPMEHIQLPSFFCSPSV